MVMTSLPVFGAAFAAGLLVGLLGLAVFWLLQKASREPMRSSMPPSSSASPSGQWVMDTTTAAKAAEAGVTPDEPKPASEQTPTSTGAGETVSPPASTTHEGAQDGNIKQWVGQQLEPIRATQREIVKSLNELLDVQSGRSEANGQLMAKLDKLQTAVDRSLELHKTDASVQLADKVGRFQATVDQSIELHKTAAKTADKLAKDLQELAEVSGRRHAATEVATEGTQEQLRGLKRELETTYTSLRDHRSHLKEHVTESGKRRMDILQESPR
eukprot:s5437_g3.t1